MAIIVYRDDEAVAIIFPDSPVGAQFQNTLQAYQDVPTSTTLSIRDVNRDLDDLTNIEFSEFVDEFGQLYGVDAPSTVNALNAVFTASGSGGGDVPVITSATTINLAQGDSLNYELTADFGVAYEWANLPSGVTTRDGNVRFLIGGETLTAGTYTVQATAINYFGSDTKSIDIIVTSSFVNTKSTNFNNNEFGKTTATTNDPFYRPSNGSGASDAWTISLWFKGGTSNNSRQTLLGYGSFFSSGGRVQIYYNGSNNQITLHYGSDFNNLTFTTPTNSIPQGIWKQIIITYDGGTTGVASGSVNDYYSRFGIWIDGVLQSTTNTNSNFGYAGNIPADDWRIANNVNSGNRKSLRNNSRLEEVACWNSDQTANVSSIYNGGTTHDLSLLASPPDNWYRMGDNDTFPVLTDNTGSTDFTLFNMSANDFVNDVP